MDRRSPRLGASPASLRTADPPARARSLVFRYGVAVVTTMVALVFKLALGPVILPSFYVPFYGAVLVSAWVGGVGPGVVASVLSFGIGQVLYSLPLAPPPGNSELTIARDVLFLCVAIGWSWGTAALHASQRRVAQVLQAARDELEARVAERTAELGETNRQLTDEMARRAAAEEQFRRAFQDAPIGIALVGLDGFSLQVNRALCAMLGYTEDELLGKSVADVTHPDDVPAARENLQRLLAGEPTAYPLEKRYIHKLGHIVWASLNVSVVRDAAGAPLHVISQVEDISERRRANQELRESEGKFRTLTETMNTAACIFQGEAVRYVNPAASRITGFTQDEMLAMNFWDIIHPDSRAFFRERGLARQRGDALPPQDEVMIVTKSGQVRWVDFTASNIEFEGRAAVLGTAVDVTERKQAAALLRESEERFRGTFEQAAVGIAHVGVDGRFLRVNRRLCEIVGYPEPELRMRTFQDITHPDDLATDLEHVRDMLDGKIQTYSMEKRYLRKDGSTLWSDLTVSLVREPSGRPEYFISVIQDIEARKRAELALRHAHEELEARVQERTAELAAANRALQAEIIQRRDAAEALRESEQRFRAIFDQAAVGVSQMGTDGRYLLVNQRMCDILGYSRAELLERSFRDVTHPDDVEASVERIRGVQANETESFNLEKRYIRKDGSVIWANLTASAIRDPTGNVKYGINIVEDISERKRAEEERVATNRRIRAILEEISDGFYTLDREGRFTYLNPSALRLFERSADQLLGKLFREVFPEAAGTPFYDQYDRLMTDRVRIDIEAYYAPRNRWFRVRGYPTQRGASVMFEDVTERHEEEVSVMTDIMGALNAHLDVSDAFPAVAAGLRRLTDCERSSVTVFEEGDEWVRVVALDEPREYLRQGVRFRVTDVPAAQDALEGRPHVVRDLAVEREFPAIRLLYAAGFRSRLSVPLQGRERILGVLNLLWQEVDRPQNVQLPIINQVAAAIALALEKSRLFDEVRAGHERLQALSRRLLEVQELERHHIARELHDEIGQLLTALKLTLDTLERLPAESALNRLRDAQQLVNDLVVRVRDLSLDLRPAMLDDLGLLPALLWLFGRYSMQTDVRVRFEHSGLDRRFDPDIETGAYRIVQEALTNVARHAEVHEATVRVWTTDHALSVQVTDLGKGFSPEAALAAGVSGGLSGLYERGALLGGRLTVESAPGRGTRVSAELCLDRA